MCVGQTRGISRLSNFSSTRTLTHIHCKDFNLITIRVLQTKSLSPMKKIKRKVGYGSEGQATNETTVQMKKLCLEEEPSTSSQGRDVDVEMKRAASQ